MSPFYTDKDGSLLFIQENSMEDHSKTKKQLIEELLRLRHKLTEIEEQEIKRRQIEIEFLKVNKLESLGLMAGRIAHDFNNLLTSILGNLSFIKMNVKPMDKIYKYLENIEKTSLRVSELTNQLIIFSKGGNPERKKISLESLIRETINVTLNGSNIHCQFNIANDLWPVEIDERHIQQVIRQMILNACEAMSEGGVIECWAHNTTLNGKDGLPLKEGNYIQLSIKDYGAGIPEENLSKIFDPYFTTKEKQGRAGFGLALCYSLIKDHQGWITVESQVGVGSIFHIFLPTSKENQENKKILQKIFEEREKPLDRAEGEGLRLMDERSSSNGRP